VEQDGAVERGGGAVLAVLKQLRSPAYQTSSTPIPSSPYLPSSALIFSLGFDGYIPTFAVTSGIALHEP